MKNLYRTVEYDNSNADLGEKEARKAALLNNTDANFRTFAKRNFNDFVFMLDDDVHLKHETLQLLVHTVVSRKLDVIAPLLTLPGKLFSNFWGALDKRFYVSVFLAKEWSIMDIGHKLRKEWLYFLDEYVRPMQEKLFIGYYQKPMKAATMFVTRYKEDDNFLCKFSTMLQHIP
uniref:Uncharacterized protein n=1 Tax=Wuchereria bancrofti TaxID=6293 RepID=A0AAF5Q3F1_WUCBA